LPRKSGATTLCTSTGPKMQKQKQNHERVARSRACCVSEREKKGRRHPRSEPRPRRDNNTRFRIGR
jgi:hypothetical protein